MWSTLHCILCTSKLSNVRAQRWIRSWLHNILNIIWSSLLRRSCVTPLFISATAVEVVSSTSHTPSSALRTPCHRLRGHSSMCIHPDNRPEKHPRKHSEQLHISLAWRIQDLWLEECEESGTFFPPTTLHWSAAFPEQEYHQRSIRPPPWTAGPHGL